MRMHRASEIYVEVRWDQQDYGLHDSTLIRRCCVKMRRLCCCSLYFYHSGTDYYFCFALAVATRILGWADRAHLQVS